MLSRAFQVFCASAVISVAAEAAAEPGETASPILELTDDNLMDKVLYNVDKPLFVKFFAPWCGHCKSMAADWEQLAEKATECVVADVDATVQTQTAEHFKIRGFPTLMMLTGDKMYEYEGRRDLADLEAFCAGGWRSASKKNLPWNQTFFDQAFEFGTEYGTKMNQIFQFEPTALPLAFLLGVLLTVTINVALGLAFPAKKTKRVRAREESKDGAKDASNGAKAQPKETKAE